jgi:DNA-directed RNA polymerase III subunit RPC4
MFLVQVPSVLPISAASKAAAVQAAASATAGSIENGSSSAKRAPAAGLTSEAAARSCSLKELPSGSLGKLLIYKSGRMKLKMGDVIMDVTPGLPCQHRMDVSPVAS